MTTALQSSLVVALPRGAATAAGQTSAATSLAAIAASVLPNPPEFLLSSAVMTRRADTTAYALGDLVVNSTPAGSVVAPSFVVAKANGGAGRINTVRLFKSGISTTNAQFRMHFYFPCRPLANGDNGAWLTTGYGAGTPSYLGSADLVVNKVFSDGAVGKGYATYGPAIPLEEAAGSQTIFAQIEARSGYTPANPETFVVSIEGDAN